MKWIGYFFYVLCGIDLILFVAAVLTDQPHFYFITGALLFGILGAVMTNLANKKAGSKEGK